MTKRILVLIIGAALVVLFAGMLFTFQVNYDEIAMVATFGRVSPDAIVNLDGHDAGLRFRWPWPIQSVIRMDRRLSVVEGRLEQQETRDKQVIIAKAFAVWHICEPLSYHRAFRAADGPETESTKAKAEAFLRERLRAAKAVISRFSFDELTNVDPERLKLDDVHDALLAQVREDLRHHNCGIDVSSVGISRILLPERITRSVFARMQQTRQRLAQNARSEGDAIARQVRAETAADRERILAFAARIADNIRAEGDAAAAEHYATYQQAPDFAVFLRKVEALERSLDKNTTFVLDTGTAPFDLLNE